MLQKPELILTLTALADDHLILGHRLSEWCGHAPMLEEDLSLPNMGLDILGQASHLYNYIAELQGNTNQDELAFCRSECAYKNLLLVEMPNGNFGLTMLRQLYFASFMHLYWKIAAQSKDHTVRGIAAKAVKEIGYHVRHVSEWVIRLGDGTKESHARMVQAVSDLHPYTGELFEMDDAAKACAVEDLLPDRASLKQAWDNNIAAVFEQADLTLPKNAPMQMGGRNGQHTEVFGFLLCELQFMQRAYPSLTW